MDWASYLISGSATKPQLSRQYGTGDRILEPLKRKKEIPFAAIWMDIEIIILSEPSQRNTNIIWYHLYVESEL